MASATTRARLQSAAFELFERRGYQQTTVEDIVDESGMSRTTFFRQFGTKEDVVFPDHEQLLAMIDAHFAETRQTTVEAIASAAWLVLSHYVGEGDLARARYRLTRSVPALRSRESAIVGEYQRRLRSFVSLQLGDGEDAQLQAELLAAAVVSVNNHVLRRWLREECDQPKVEFDLAIERVSRLFADEYKARPAADAAVVLLTNQAELTALLPRLRTLLAGE
jgi:AcrR family transcriptional regulator